MAVGASAAHATFFHFYTNVEINKQSDLFAMGI
jgi:hypothetical protein